MCKNFSGQSPTPSLANAKFWGVVAFFSFSVSRKASSDVFFWKTFGPHVNSLNYHFVFFTKTQPASLQRIQEKQKINFSQSPSNFNGLNEFWSCSVTPGSTKQTLFFCLKSEESFHVWTRVFFAKKKVPQRGTLIFAIFLKKFLRSLQNKDSQFSFLEPVLKIAESEKRRSLVQWNLFN